MHAEAREWLTRVLGDAGPTTRVLEFGALDINGSVRSIIPDAGLHVGIDLYNGPGVDVVADASRWMPDRTYDLVIAAEVFEHSPRWPQMLDVAWRALRINGWVVITCATDPRAPHSATDGRPLTSPPGEFYRNVPVSELAAVMRARGFLTVTDGHPRGDLYAIGVKPKD